MKYLLLTARILFSFIFIMGGVGHFSDATIGYAAAQGVPLAAILVPVSGILCLAGGLSILLGYKTRWGAWLLVLFLLPVTIMMHPFWKTADPNMAQMQQVMFIKNFALMGGALLFAYFGSGPLSLDNRAKKAMG